MRLLYFISFYSNWLSFTISQVLKYFYQTLTNNDYLKILTTITRKWKTKAPINNTIHGQLHFMLTIKVNFRELSFSFFIIFSLCSATYFGKLFTFCGPQFLLLKNGYNFFYNITSTLWYYLEECLKT